MFLKRHNISFELESSLHYTPLPHRWALRATSSDLSWAFQTISIRRPDVQLGWTLQLPGQGPFASIGSCKSPVIFLSSLSGNQLLDWAGNVGIPDFKKSLMQARDSSSPSSCPPMARACLGKLEGQGEDDPKNSQKKALREHHGRNLYLRTWWENNQPLVHPVLQQVVVTSRRGNSSLWDRNPQQIPTTEKFPFTISLSAPVKWLQKLPAEAGA